MNTIDRLFAMARASLKSKDERLVCAFISNAGGVYDVDYTLWSGKPKQSKHTTLHDLPTIEAAEQTISEIAEQYPGGEYLVFVDDFGDIEGDALG